MELFAAEAAAVLFAAALVAALASAFAALPAPLPCLPEPARTPSRSISSARSRSAPLSLTTGWLICCTSLAHASEIDSMGFVFPSPQCVATTAAAPRVSDSVALYRVPQARSRWFRCLGNMTPRRRSTDLVSYAARRTMSRHKTQDAVGIPGSAALHVGA